MKKILFNVMAWLVFVYRFLTPAFLARKYNKWKYGRIRKRAENLRNTKDNGIYYFLGNFHQHMSHVMPLYDVIGGTVVVLSASAHKEVEKYGVNCIYIDSNDDIWLELDKRIKNTVNFLNKNAKITIFYDAFYWRDVSISSPTLWLGHGTGFVKGAIWDRMRLSELNKLTAVATLGELGQKILSSELEPQKMKKISPARIDEIANSAVLSKSEKNKIKSALGVPVDKTVITYMPTYWGPSSVERLGIEIMENISDDKAVIFWPHPQTPNKIIKKYTKLIKDRANIIEAQAVTGVNIADVYAVTDKFITDHSSSVVVDMILLNKPIIFAFGGGDSYDHTVDRSPLRFLVRRSDIVTPDNVENINSLLNNGDKVDAKLLRRALGCRFAWFPNGGATVRIIKIINQIGFSGRMLSEDSVKHSGDRK